MFRVEVEKSYYGDREVPEEVFTISRASTAMNYADDNTIGIIETNFQLGVFSREKLIQLNNAISDALGVVPVNENELNNLQETIEEQSCKLHELEETKVKKIIFEL